MLREPFPVRSAISSVTTTDSEIIRRSIDHPPSFGELFDRHARDLGNYIARRVGTDHAEDILSETFLVAFRRRAAFDTDWDSAKPWLLGIASILVRKHRGAEVTHWRSLEVWARLGDSATDGDLGAAVARADARAAIKDLAPRIATLARRDLDTLLLYAWGDLTYEEVGRALRVPTGTVRSRLNRVRRRLSEPAVVALDDVAHEPLEEGIE